MNFHVFLVLAITATFIKSIFMPGWYTGIEFVSSLAALCVLAKVLPPNKKMKNEELEEMKHTIEGLTLKIRETANGVTGIKMRFGLKDLK